MSDTINFIFASWTSGPTAIRSNLPPGSRVLAVLTVSAEQIALDPMAAMVAGGLNVKRNEVFHETEAEVIGRIERGDAYVYGVGGFFHVGVSTAQPSGAKQLVFGNFMSLPIPYPQRR
jgi:hypothetical protein